MNSAFSARTARRILPARHWPSAGGGAIQRIAIAAIATVVLSILSNSVIGSERWWHGPVQTTIAIGDGMSLADARLLGIRSLQWNAAAAAGAQLTTIEKLDNDRYSAAIELVTASEVQLTDIEQSVSSTGQTIFLTMKGTAKTSLDAIADRMRLVRENKELAQALSDLQAHLASVPSSDDKSLVLQTPLINSLASDASRILRREERAALLRADSAHAENLQRELVEHIERQIMMGTQVSATIDSISERDGGAIVRVVVRVHAQIPLDDIAKVAGKYWVTTHAHDPYLGGRGLVVSVDKKVNNSSHSEPLRAAGEHLLAQYYGVEVQIGDQRKAMPIAGPEGPWCLLCFGSHIGASAPPGKFTLRSVETDTDPGTAVSNLLVLDIPRAQFSGEQTLVSARVVQYRTKHNWQRQYITAVN